jgi:hypothetical protein
VRWAGHVAHMGELRNTYSILVGKSEGKRQPAKSKYILDNSYRLYERSNSSSNGMFLKMIKHAFVLVTSEYREFQ